jgi:tripartite-type tricarboxylate transporter receptor subunit TctC
VIAGTPNAIPTAPLSNPNGVRFDPNKLSWIGSATKELYIGYVWRDAPVKTFAEARDKEVLLGGVTVGSFSTDVGILASEFFGMKFKTITGYKSSPEIQLAVERGEVHGVMGTAFSALKIAQQKWLSDNKVRIIVQFGLERHPLYPDTPLYIDFAKNEEQRKAILFYTGNLAHGKPYFAPPDLPPERLETLRRAFDATMTDAEFLADLRATGGEIDSPMTGEQLAAFVAEENRTPANVIEMVQQALAKF